MLNQRVTALDGLRALAVLLVVADHALWPDFQGGGFGVSVFFVISGFLITTLLMKERDRNGGVALRLFYGRRALRLYPALIVMLVVTVALGCSGKDAVIAATYTTDLYNMFRRETAGAYQHTWSLSLEEQFYLLWPLILPLAMRSRRAIPLLAVAALISLAGFLAVVLHGDSSSASAAAFGPLVQAHALLIGCGLALLLRKRPVSSHANSLALGGTAVIAAVVVGMSIVPNAHLVPAWSLVLDLAAAALVAGLASGAAVRVYELRPVVWIGERSYGIYLWHYPLIVLVPTWGITGRPGAFLAVALGFLAAAASYRWVETPFLKLKDRLHAPGSPALAAVEPAAA